MRLQTALISESGGRRENEDHCAYLERGGLVCYVLADGLGGHRGGRLASRTAVEKILEAFAASPGMAAGRISEYLEHARLAFAGDKTREPYLKTTLVLLLSDYRQATWGHIGDSRLYRFSGGAIVYQTRDHSLPQLMANAGEITADEIRFHEDRNRLTAAFDGEDLSRFKFLESPVSLMREDAFLLCSDGFWEYVYEAEMEEDLAASTDSRDWIKRMERRLLVRAPDNHDNYSAIGVKVS